MQLVNKEKFNKRIQGLFDYRFEVEENGFYLIEIIASCKSWWQNLIKFVSFFKDDDLTIKIDDFDFPKLDGRRGLFDGEVAWNGNDLKGLKKTNIFLMYLKKGKHTVHFLVDQKPYLEIIQIYFVKHSVFNISCVPEDNNPAEDGNRRQWLTIVLINFSLKSLSISAKAEKRKKDDDDLKLIIDNKIQKNHEASAHKCWYWCGRTLKGRKKEFNKELNLSRGLHYIELWADRTPRLERIDLDLGEETENGTIRPKPYIYKGVTGAEDYNRFDTAIGEVVGEWNEKFLKQEYPPPELLDPNLVKAIIYIESRMGYEKNGYPDVMQVGNENDPAIHTLNNDGWIDPRTGNVAREYEWRDGKTNVLDCEGKVKVEKPGDSVKWGVRWLYHKAQKIKDDENGLIWLSWKEAVERYGPGTKKYVNDVWNVYEKGLTRRGIRLWSVLFVPFLISTAILGWWLYTNQGRVYISFEDIRGTEDYRVIAKIIDGIFLKKVWLANTYLYGINGDNFYSLDKDKSIRAWHKDLDSDGQEEIIITGWHEPGYETVYILKKKNGEFKKIHNVSKNGYMAEAFSAPGVVVKDINHDGRCEVVERFPTFYGDNPRIYNHYYRLNENGIYEFLKKERVLIEDTDKYFLWQAPL